MSHLNKRSHSLTRRLLLYLLIPVVLIILLAAAWSVRTSGRMVNALHDQQLQANAEILLSFLHYELNEHADTSEEDAEDDDDDDDEDDDEKGDTEELIEEISEAVDEIEAQHQLSVNYRLVLGDSLLFTSSRVRRLPACQDGFSHIDGEAIEPQSDGNAGNRHANVAQWRCFRKGQTLQSTSLPIVVEFFEPVDQRQNAIRSLLLNTFLPVFLLPLVIALITVWAVRRGMRSVRSVTRAVSLRSVDNLEKLPVHNQPEELVPVVDSVNKLLAGIERGIEREKQFTDDAAHELRTPITSIKMLEQLLRRENTDPALADYLDGLRDSVAQSSNLIEQLLSFARLQAASDLVKSGLDIQQLLVSQLGLLSAQLTEKALAVETDAPQVAVTVQANEPALALLLNNLLSNAIKFSPRQGSIYLTLTTQCLKIEDDGPGIPAQERERIFERFYRGKGASATPGSGLGLALASWVAEVHDFRLEADSPTRGRGACIVLYFTGTS